jgi:phosphoglycolate phosphatase-like HAD superfamily hydrolase
MSDVPRTIEPVLADVKTLVLDLDDTVWPTNSSLASALNAFIEVLAPRCGGETVVKAGLKKVFDKAKTIDCGPDAIIEGLKDERVIPRVRAGATDAMAGTNTLAAIAFLQKLHAKCRPYPGMREFVINARNKKVEVFALSDGPIPEVLAKMRSVQMGRLFNGIVAQDVLGFDVRAYGDVNPHIQAIDVMKPNIDLAPLLGKSDLHIREKTVVVGENALKDAATAYHRFNDCRAVHAGYGDTDDETRTFWETVANAEVLSRNIPQKSAYTAMAAKMGDRLLLAQSAWDLFDYFGMGEVRNQLQSILTFKPDQ